MKSSKNVKEVFDLLKEIYTIYVDNEAYTKLYGLKNILVILSDDQLSDDDKISEITGRYQRMIMSGGAGGFNDFIICQYDRKKNDYLNKRLNTIEREVCSLLNIKLQ